MARISRICKNLAVAAVIIAAVFASVYFSVAGMAARVVKHEDSVVSVVTARLDAYACDQAQPTLPPGGGRYVVLRLDDVQDSAWDDVAIHMMREAFRRGAPVTAGVIPKGILDDDRITRFLRDNSCRVEIAQHGFDHQDVPGDEEEPVYGEFAKLGKVEARTRIDDGRALLRHLLPEGKDIVTFIPPENEISDEGKQALRDAGFKMLSAEGYAPLDYTASTYDFYEKRLVPVDTVLGKCRGDLDRDGVCVIMLHPQDYADADGFIDPDKYKEYLRLLDGLQEENIRFVTFSELSRTRQYPY